ncbi:PSF3 protein, partial [Brachypodius atriceps]|nr:PSF3 protein [Brachypodius atriceps]
MSEAYFPVGPGLGMEENFLSLDDILMSQEKLPGRAESALPRLAVLLGQSAGSAESIPEGSKLEIPLWLAKGLHDSKRRMISVELPKIYKEAWRTVFSADANVVDLHKMGPYYYGFGSQLLNFENPENPEIAQTILQATGGGCVLPVSDCACSPQTFIARFRRIMDSSQNAYNEDTSVLVARLDELERALFQVGQKGLNDFQCWEKGQASQITASSLVQNYGKRKLTEVDG